MGSPREEHHHDTDAAVRVACDPCKATMSGDDVKPELMAIWDQQHEKCGQ